jgi:hypothetical protein
MALLGHVGGRLISGQISSSSIGCLCADFLPLFVQYSDSDLWTGYAFGRLPDCFLDRNLFNPGRVGATAFVISKSKDGKDSMWMVCRRVPPVAGPTLSDRFVEETSQRFEDQIERVTEKAERERKLPTMRLSTSSQSIHCSKLAILQRELA